MKLTYVYYCNIIRTQKGVYNDIVLERYIFMDDKKLVITQKRFKGETAVLSVIAGKILLIVEN